MPDLALAWDLAAASADLVVENNDFKGEYGLETAVLISLCCDARAAADDDIPDGTTNRRGWWGDEFLENPGDHVGSKLWLLDRSKIEPFTLRRIQSYASECLAWMIEDKVARQIIPTATLGDNDYCLTIGIDEQTFGPWPGAWLAQLARGG